MRLPLVLLTPVGWTRLCVKIFTRPNGWFRILLSSTLFGQNIIVVWAKCYLEGCMEERSSRVAVMLAWKDASSEEDDATMEVSWKKKVVGEKWQKDDPPGDVQSYWQRSLHGGTFLRLNVWKVWSNIEMSKKTGLMHSECKKFTDNGQNTGGDMQEDRVEPTICRQIMDKKLMMHKKLAEYGQKSSA